jgi:membrane-associated phospholipid phosphatase
MRSRPARPLLADQVRPRVAGLLGCCVILVATLGVLFAHQSQADWLDHAIDLPVYHWLGGHDNLLLWLAYPATLVPAGLVSLVMAVICLRTGRLTGAVLAVAAVPVTAALNDALLKPLVQRTIGGHPAYPSGHVAAILAVTTMLTVLLAPPPRPPALRLLRLLILTAAGVVACGVAIAVIGLRWHYFTDTIGGAAVGIGTVCALAILLDLPVVRRNHEERGNDNEGTQPDAEQRR